jgi:hypothetical protein
MANSLLLLVALVVAGCTALASATTYTVGDSQGWTTNFDYSTWASGKSFAVGDKLGELALVCSFTYVSFHQA